MASKLSDEQKRDREIRAAEASLRRRRILDSGLRFLRSCAVCTSFLPPIDLLCPVCWRELGLVMNRGPRLRQPDSIFPTYALLTWTPQTERFVRPLIYGFKGGFAVRAAETLAALFLHERLTEAGAAPALDTMTGLAPRPPNFSAADTLLISAPAAHFDHSQAWSAALARQLQVQTWPLLKDKQPTRESQKGLRQTERANRRHLVKEHFAQTADEARFAKRTVLADDVITTGSTAMAAYMALGDPDQFEVWTLVARPRLAGKAGFC